ncbi:hypothetical protein AMJ86_01335 [bacterium SM23_57]|nr:MAG: hypothetical protein AMJ86_01335 [bacterium SM23_57]
MNRASIFLHIVFLLIFFSTISFSQTTISGNLTGTLPGNTYIVVGNIYVRYGDSLTIEPGARFLFHGNYSFDIYGYLRAVGTRESKILFVPDHGTFRWGGIKLKNTSSDQSILEYCFITGSFDSGICLESCSPTVTHCEITENTGDYGGGIACYDGAAPRVICCKITYNEVSIRGGGISCRDDSYPTFTKCNISYNSSNDRGGGASNDFSNPYYENCKFFENTAATQGGGVQNSTADVILKNCIFANNWAGMGGGAIRFDFCIHPKVFNCIIVGNRTGYDGAGIISYYSHFTVINCTIVKNSSPYQGGGIQVGEGSRTTTVNTIVAGNSHGMTFNYTNPSSSFIRYCDFFDNVVYTIGGNSPPIDLCVVVSVNANGDSCDVHSNILENPCFVSYGARDFHLQNDSHCIGAGDPSAPATFDIEGKPRPYPQGSISDIGAHEHWLAEPSTGERIVFEDISSYGSDIPTEYRLEQNWPNPFNASTTIKYHIPEENLVLINIYDIMGNEVATLVNETLPAGSYTLAWYADDCPSGIYFCCLKLQDFHQFKKMILIK